MMESNITQVPPLNNLINANYEYRLVIKRKQTMACDRCRKRKGKCNGGYPCSYCKDKNFICNFSSQQKRGRRKLDNEPNNETNKIIRGDELWNDNEQYALVDTFCDMRLWWNNLIDTKAVKESKSNGFIAQNYLINAWMARISLQTEKELYYYNKAMDLISKREEKDNLLSWATTFLLLGDYDPSSSQNYSISWDIVKNANPVTKQEMHVFNYSMSCHSVAISPDDRYNSVLSFGNNALKKNTVDIWDTTNLLVVRICTSMFNFFKHFGSLDFYFNINTLFLSEEEKNKTMVDIRTAEVIVQSMPHLFGFEFPVCLTIAKISTMWACGERKEAVEEAIAFVQTLSDLKEKTWFLLSEVRYLVIVVAILRESGIIKYSQMMVKFIYEISRGRDLVNDLIPLLDSCSLDSSLSSSPSSSLSPSSSSPSSSSPSSSLSPSVDNYSSPLSFPISSPLSPTDDFSSILSLQQDTVMNWDNIDLDHFLS